MLQVGHGLLYPALRKAAITIGPGRTPSAAQFQDAIDELNRLISSLNCDRLFIYALDTIQIPITDNQSTLTIGCDPTGATAELPETAPGMISRLPGVTAVQDIGTVNGVSVYKSPLIPPIDTNALTVDAATLNLPAVAGTSVAYGAYLNAATARQPVAVLGAAAAQRLGIDRIRPGTRIWAGGQWLYVTGILNPDTYAPEIDSAVLIGFPAAKLGRTGAMRGRAPRARTQKRELACTLPLPSSSAARYEPAPSGRVPK